MVLFDSVLGIPLGRDVVNGEDSSACNVVYVRASAVSGKMNVYSRVYDSNGHRRHYKCLQQHIFPVGYCVTSSGNSSL